MTHKIIQTQDYLLVVDETDGVTMVEVGVYEGKSLAFLVVEGINTGKNFKVYGVDEDLGVSQTCIKPLVSFCFF